MDQAAGRPWDLPLAEIVNRFEREMSHLSTSLHHDLRQDQRDHLDALGHMDRRQRDIMATVANHETHLNMHDMRLDQLEIWRLEVEGRPKPQTDTQQLDIAKVKAASNRRIAAITGSFLALGKLIELAVQAW